MSSQLQIPLPQWQKVRVQVPGSNGSASTKDLEVLPRAQFETLIRRLNSQILGLSGQTPSGSTLYGPLNMGGNVIKNVTNTEAPESTEAVSYSLSQKLYTGVRPSTLVKTNDYSIQAADGTVEAQSDTLPLKMTLPLASEVPGKVFWVKRSANGTNDVTVQAQSSDSIDGNPNYLLADANAVVGVQSDGTSKYNILTGTTGTAVSSSGGFSAGGDLTGTNTLQTVIGFDGVALDSSVGAPANGDTIVYDSSSGTYKAQAGAPGSFTAGGDLSGTSTSQTVIGLEGVALDAATVGSPVLGYVITFNGTKYVAAALPVMFAAGGDLSGTATLQTVVGLEGVPLDATTVGAPSDGEVLAYDLALGKYIAEQIPVQGVNIGFADGITPTDSGDHQNFTLPESPDPTASLLLYLNGQELNQGSDYTLSGSTITLASPLSGTWNLEAWFRYVITPAALEFADDVTPTDSGDHQHFTLPSTPNPAESLQLFLNGMQLLNAGSDYTLSGANITLTSALTGTWTLEAWYRTAVVEAFPNFADNVIPTDSGDHQNFMLPSTPDPPESLELYLNGVQQQEGVGEDFVLSTNSITLSAPVSGSDTLQAWYRYTFQSAAPNYSDSEIPTDSGDRQHFTLAHAPNPKMSMILALGGLVLTQGVSDDYTISGVNLVLATAATPPFNLVCWYRF